MAKAILCECGHFLRKHQLGEEASPCMMAGCGCVEFVEKKKQVKPEKKYIILEVFEEKEYNEKEVLDEISWHVNWSEEDVESVKFEKVEAERLIGTRFFRMPASLFFTKTDENKNSRK